MIYFREHILFFVFFWKMIMRALEYVDSKITHTLTVLETFICLIWHSRISWPRIPHKLMPTKNIDFTVSYKLYQLNSFVSIDDNS